MDEEIGVTVTNLRNVNSSTFVTDSGISVVDIVFLCSYEVGEPFAKDPDEVESVQWMTTQEILNHVEIPSFLKSNIQLVDYLVKINSVTLTV